MKNMYQISKKRRAALIAFSTAFLSMTVSFSTNAESGKKHTFMKYKFMKICAVPSLPPKLEGEDDEDCIINATGPNGEDIFLLRETRGDYNSDMKYSDEDAKKLMQRQASSIECVTANGASDLNCDGVNDETQSSNLVQQRISRKLSERIRPRDMKTLQKKR